MRVLVTGGSGFVGRRLCTMLVSQGHEVVAPVRGEAVRAPMPEGVNTVPVIDPLNLPLLAPLLDRVDAIAHLAARVHVMRESASDPLTEFRRVNVEGTRAVVAAARAAGVGHLVFVSSIKVNGEGRDAPYTEADVPRPVDPYGQSKLDAEGVVQAIGSGLSWTILRPPLVYGPGVGGNFRRLLRLAGLAGRWPLPLGGIDNLRSMIFVDNLADAIAQSLVHPAARGQTFMVSDDHDVGVSELLGRLAVALGGRPRLIRAPVALLRQGAAMAGRSADVDRLLGTLRVNCSLVRSALQWQPPVSLSDGLDMTARWWRHEAAA